MDRSMVVDIKYVHNAIKNTKPQNVNIVVI